MWGLWNPEYPHSRWLSQTTIGHPHLIPQGVPFEAGPLRGMQYNPATWFLLQCAVRTMIYRRYKRIIIRRMNPMKNWMKNEKGMKKNLFQWNVRLNSKALVRSRIRRFHSKIWVAPNGNIFLLHLCREKQKNKNTTWVSWRMLNWSADKHFAFLHTQYTPVHKLWIQDEQKSQQQYVQRMFVFGNVRKLQEGVTLRPSP